MVSKLIEDERLQDLNDKPERREGGDYVLYWMQQSQRAEHNPALEFAIQQANRLGQRLMVVFGLMDDYPEANLRNYAFMLEGLRDVEQSLKRRGIRLQLRHGHPAKVAAGAAGDASLVICDRGYLRHQKTWRREVARESPCRVVQVEGDVVVPVETASDKAEWAARTLRPRIARHRNRFLRPLATTPLEKDSLNLAGQSLDIEDTDNLLERLKIDRSVCRVSYLFRGGTREAKTVLRRFLDRHLKGYDENRNRPETNYLSYMAMFLHFGQISPVWLALRIKESSAPEEDIDSYLEEMIVRRELSMNFVHFTPDHYDSYSCLPDWAKRTLAEHRDDPREHRYSRSELEAGKTHDPYWNAAMKEMRETGYMHNYMRMYWGKKILEWCNTPEYAFRTALELNNKYFLDGRDCNSFGNVAWIFGLHDRAWTERPVFGKVRYMAASGLERKCDIQGYVRKVEEIAEGKRQEDLFD